ncbi:aspartyl protease [Thioalkalivibrio denitrificans]|uniref:Aspartyl protease n=1 Tax=Thioalkalivibrio denitrificans TaxID=108003 RepID=A0A1V3NJC6_9GAMM|nr:TIGR02281 family clan AA aspartic protease [Thioalkalivibrio denitrificans]OOG25209.1 aspartyl protease [Thioalkalivibrio denitrificans]
MTRVRALTALVAALILMLAGPLQARDLLVLGIFPDRALIQVDGERHVLRVGEATDHGIRLLSTDSRAGHVTLEVAGQRRQVALGSRAGGAFQPRQSSRAQIYPNSAGAYTTTGSVNGRTVTFLVDTGATSVAMNSNEARRLGIDYTRGHLTQVHTASGTAFAYRVTLDRVRVGDIEQRNVEAMVVTGDAPRIALLGMSFLNRVELRNEGQALILEQRF